MSDCLFRAVVVLIAASLAACSSQVPMQKPNFALNKYVVRPGDTIELVAWRYGLTPDQLRARNRLSGGSALEPGTLLVISGPVKPKAKVQVAKNKRVVVPTPVASQPVRQVETVVLPASVKYVEAEEIIESVEFEKSANKVAAIKPAIKKRTVSEDGWVWPANGAVARGFQKNVVNRQGLDIAGRRGEDIVAAADGTVVYSGQDLASHGKLVILRHKNNVLTAYSLAKTLFVQEDDVVQAGDAIASLGDTEDQSAILHFEIRKDGEPVNPMKYLPKR